MQLQIKVGDTIETRTNWRIEVTKVERINLEDGLVWGIVDGRGAEPIYCGTVQCIMKNLKA